MPTWVIMIQQGPISWYLGKNGKLVENRKMAWSCKKEATALKKFPQVVSNFSQYKVYISEL